MYWSLVLIYPTFLPYMVGQISRNILIDIHSLTPAFDGQFFPANCGMGHLYFRFSKLFVKNQIRCKTWY